MLRPLIEGLSRLLSGRATSGSDESDAGRRARERESRVLMSGMASVLSKVITISVMLVTVPLCVRYLGEERYGLWMTVSSAVALLGFADLGIGNGLVTSLATALGSGDEEKASRLVSSAIAMAVLLAVSVGVLFAVAYPLVDWAKLLNATSPVARAEAGPALAALVVSFAAGMPLSIVQRVQSGSQEAYLTNLWLGGGSLLGLFCILLAIRLEATLWVFVAASAGAPVVALLAASIVEFGVRKPALRPRWTMVQRGTVRGLLGTGALFITVQVAVTIMSTADNLVAARVLGPEAVTELSIASRLFVLSPMLLGMFLGPLWPAYGEAMARGDRDWIRRTFKRSLALAALVSVPLAIGGLLFGRWIIGVWVGPGVVPDVALVAGLAAWSLLGSVGGAMAMLLNGLQLIRFQAASAVLMSVAAVVGKVWLARTVGLAGIPWASVAANAIFVTAPAVVVVTRALAALPSERPTAA